MERWKIKDGKEGLARDFVDNNPHETRKRLGAACGRHPNTIRRLLIGEPIPVATVKAIFGAVLGFPKGRFSKEQLSSIEAAMGEYCDPVTESDEAEREATTMPAGTKNKNAGLACMVVVLKFVHLRDRRKRRPAYTRSVARLGGQAVEVYSEYFSVRTLYFRNAPDTLELQASRAFGTVDMQPVLPPALALLGDEAEDYHVCHEAPKPGPLSQVAVTILNGIQADGGFPGNEAMGALVPEPCDRVVLVVDMLSIPVAPGGSLHASPPTAWHRLPVGQTHKETQLGCAESVAGVFVIDTAEPFGEPDAPGAWPGGRALLAKDQVIIRLALNWDALP